MELRTVESEICGVRNDLKENIETLKESDKKHDKGL